MDADRCELKVSVKNIGKVAGREAVQLYVKAPNGGDVYKRQSKDTIFGITLENRETIWKNKGISMETGVLSKNGVPLIQMVAVCLLYTSSFWGECANIAIIKT